MKVCCMGVMIMDMFPSAYGIPLSEVASFRPVPGGAPMNVAVAVRRLGLASSYIGAVGNDVFGQVIRSMLLNNKVDVNSVKMDPERRTTLNFHAKPSSGTTEYLFYRNPGADTNLSITDIYASDLTEATILHFDSMCLTDDPMKTATEYAVDAVRLAGGLISLDCNYRSPVWSSPEECRYKVFGMLPSVDIFKANHEEIALLMPGLSIDSAAAALLDMGPKLIIVTKGSEGSSLYTKSFAVHQEALDISVVDTIGCGDAFIGGFIARFLGSGKQLSSLDRDTAAECALYADTVASLTATKSGALSALPTGTQVQELFESRRSEHGPI